MAFTVLCAILIATAAVTSSKELKSDLLIGAPFEVRLDSDTHNLLFQQFSTLTICQSNINQARANNGKGPVNSHSQVEQAAYNHNIWMVQNNCFSHQCPGEAGPGDRLSATGYRWGGYGEILAAGSSTCEGAINMWLNSEGHKNIMLGNYQHVGCSGIQCTNCQYGFYWTCVFASPL